MRSGRSGVGVQGGRGAHAAPPRRARQSHARRRVAARALKADKKAYACFEALPPGGSGSTSFLDHERET